MNRGDRRAARGDVTPAANDPASLCEAGIRHLRVGRHLDATMVCQKALALDPDHAAALHLMGQLALESGHQDHAVEWFARAIKQDSNADYLASLGTALQRQGRYDEASKALDKAVQLRPEDAGLWTSLGVLLEETQRPADALLCFQHALRLDPNHLAAAFRSAVLLQQSGKPEEALAWFDQCDRQRPNHARTIASRAVVWRNLKRYEDYLADGVRALALDPDNAEICHNVADALLMLGRFEEALEWLDRVLKLKPYFALSVLALDNKAIAFRRLHRFDEALALYHHMRAIDPANAKAEFDLGNTNLLLGNFADGWREREARWRTRGLSFGSYSGPEPVWLGQEDIAGKAILLWSDEGLGDAIQFTRYVPMLTRRGARVVLSVQDTLRSLLGGLPGVSDCISNSSVILPPIDFQCAVTSLPLAFQTTLDTIPPPAPLSAPAHLVSGWDKRLGRHDRLRVGLVWSGNSTHVNDQNRSIPLKCFSEILNVDADFVSVQRDPRADDKAVLIERTEIVDLTPELTDFVETAALIACLDLVITVDTSVAHLAGALGRPTWILLPYTPDFRWLLDRDDSPWYPSVRLFRQGERRNYDEVLARVRDELQKLAASFSR
jgi:tetratricopeptide (TPR) repeat protein